MLPYDPKIKEFAQKLRAGGMGYHEIAAAINEKFNESFDYSRAKNICRSACNGKRTLSPQKITEKQGATERKPKYEIIDDKYVIYFGKTKKLVATADELEKAFQLFCLADLTMNATALKMGWSREQFFAAKTSFDITKDAIPLLPETIDTLTADEISEKIRIAKKQYAIQKIHENKAKDIERDNKRFHDRNYLFSLAAERINAIDSSPFKVVNHKKADELYLLAISDVHAGMRINNRFSRYNLDIMRERFERVTAEILSLIKPCELTILDAGDLLAGGIHASVVKSSENPVDSLFSVTECYLKLCTTLMSKGFKIRFASVGGNHDSIVAEKTARVNSESYARLFDWALRLKLADCKSIDFIDNDNSMALIPFFDYHVLALHGVSSKLSRFERLYPKERIIEVLAGHLHNYSAQTEDNLPVYRLNSFCSADEYALNLGLSSESGARLITYGLEGRICDRFIRL